MVTAMMDTIADIIESICVGIALAVIIMCVVGGAVIIVYGIATLMHFSDGC